MRHTIHLTALLCISTSLAAASIDEAFSAGSFEGELRTPFIANASALGAIDYATAIGGVIHYETAPWEGLSWGISSYFSQRPSIGVGSDERYNGDFFDENNASYAYLGEFYLDYTYEALALRLGRMALDMPYIDTDDIRMHPNTFEALHATYALSPTTTLFAGYVTQWAGFDSGEDKSTFKPFTTDSYGTRFGGITDESIENLTLGIWYVGIDKSADIGYADASYTYHITNDIRILIDAQSAYFLQSQASGMEGLMLGGALHLEMGAFTLEAAHTRTYNPSGTSVSNGQGGGPYLSSMEEWTIADLENARAYVAGMALSGESLGVEGLEIALHAGRFADGSATVSIEEWDMGLAYAPTPTLSFEMVLVNVIDKLQNADEGSDASHLSLLGRVQYTFAKAQ
ncbi:MAG: hypothetical protein KU37_11475 [Sulfuricurvum sp. PC08-66]|nr:MAG: hypothetical protein KU37_11475 [Sulfuricurvum sp. PC08-66]